MIGSSARIILAAMLLMGAAGVWGQQRYPLPAVPDTITAVEARADYVTAHYWEAFDFQDSTLLRQDYAEQAMADFLGLLPYASEQGKALAVNQWLDGASASRESYNYFADQATDYLRRTDSPLYDAKLYQLVASHIASCDVADETQRSRARMQLRLLGLNQPGTVAGDFAYVTADGQSGTLSQTGRDRLTLLLFFDPDCHRCQDLLFRLKHSSVLNQAIAEGRLTVMAVYADGDREILRQIVAELPSQWLTVADEGSVHDGDSYDLTQLPALYLLDSQKRVVLKEADFRQVTERLTDGTLR